MVPEKLVLSPVCPCPWPTPPHTPSRDPLCHPVEVTLYLPKLNRLLGSPATATRRALTSIP